MKILGIDTSTMAANVAVLEDDKLICEYTINTTSNINLFNFYFYD